MEAGGVKNPKNTTEGYIAAACKYAVRAICMILLSGMLLYIAEFDTPHD